MDLVNYLRGRRVVPKSKYWGVVEATARLSLDPKRKVGAIIVAEDGDIVSSGYNGLPRGILDDHRAADPELKLKYTVHAEVNAIINAGRQGKCVRGYSILVNLFPCVECAKVIIQAGIKSVYAPNTPLLEPNSKWAKGAEESICLLEEAGVRVVLI